MDTASFAAILAVICLPVFVTIAAELHSWALRAKLRRRLRRLCSDA